jgi:hypothetical protein
MKTRRNGFNWSACLYAGLALSAAQTALSAGYVELSRTGEQVLTVCNPTDSATNTRCRVLGLPGVPGYQLVASRSAPLIYNDVTIGTVQERVWKNANKPKVHIFGMRVVMSAEPWDSSGAAFNINDLFRQTLPNKRVSIACFQDGATKALRKSGRTVQGLNEFEEEHPERDNTWVDFRVDVNAADPDGVSSPQSPWLLTRTRAPSGFALNPLGLRVLNSDFEDTLDAVDFFTASYQPNGVPPPEDDEEDDDD